MSVYEAVRVYKQKGVFIKDKINVSELLRNICCFGLSVLFSMAGFNENFSPFGIAFVCAVSKKYTLISSLGACIGYFFSLDSVGALRYTSSVLACAVIMISLKSVKSLKGNDYVCAAVAFISVLTTGLAITLSAERDFVSLILNISEAIVCSGTVFVFLKSKVYLCVRGGLKTLTSKEITSVIICGALLLLSLRYAVFFGISLGNVISVFIILICAYYAKEAGGAVSGVCCGAAMAIGSGDLTLLSFYSLGGLLCGVFSSYGRAVTVSVFSLSGLLVYLFSTAHIGLFSLLTEVVVSSAAFVFVSFRFNYNLENFFIPELSLPVVDSVKNNIVNKLHRASEFSTEICTTLNNVNQALSKSQKNEESQIPNKIKEKICYNCALRDSCWGEQRNITHHNFEKLTELKKNGIYLDSKTVPASFLSSCIRGEYIVSDFNKLFSEYRLKVKTEKRIKEIQALATEQFVNVSDLLESLCESVDEELRFDMDIATRCKAVSLSFGDNVLDCCCMFDSSDKLLVELRVKNPYNKNNLQGLSKQVCTVTGRLLQLPVVEEYNDYTKIIFKEKSELKAVPFCVQYNAPGEKYSGDSYTTFLDDKGFFYAAICDGMGTGTVAALSSGLAVNLLEKLIKAGFSVESAVKTVNTSLVSKSGDECSVTLDLMCLDLYTGRCEFYKCGAQSTMLKKHGKISTLTINSVPLGILTSADIQSHTESLSPGDVVVLCSDGVREEDFWSLRNGLKVFDRGNVKEFTQDIAQTVRRSQPEKTDDFTIMTVAVTKGE